MKVRCALNDVLFEGNHMENPRTEITVGAVPTLVDNNGPQLSVRELKVIEGARYNATKQDPKANLVPGGGTQKPLNPIGGKKLVKAPGPSRSTKYRRGQLATAIEIIGTTLGAKVVADIKSGMITEKSAIAISKLPAHEHGDALARAKLGQPVVVVLPRDDDGKKVPESLTAVFEVVPEFDILLNKALPKVVDAVRELDHKLAIGGKLKKPAEALYSSLCKLISSHRPGRICVLCSGAGCPKCKHKGYTTTR